MREAADCRRREEYSTLAKPFVPSLNRMLSHSSTRALDDLAPKSARWRNRTVKTPPTAISGRKVGSVNHKEVS